MATGLIDTNILVDLLRGYQPAQTWIATESYLGVSRIAYLELIAGARNKADQTEALKLLNTFELVEFEQTDFQWATNQLISFFLSHNVGIFDCLIAAPAHRLQIPLYTQNMKHFTPLIGTLAQKPY